MYDTNDTIVAVSSPSPGARAIVRVTGPATIDTCQRIFHPPIRIRRNGILPGTVAVDDELQVDALLYLFFAPHSYTGEDVAEIHLHGGAPVTEALVENLLEGKTPKMSFGAKHQSPITDYQVRTAGPGEFTARAYLAGKIDLAQAEAVNEVVVGSNTFQLAAAEKLLSGGLADTTTQVQSAIMECLSLIEAGIDFSREDIEFWTQEDAIARLVGVKGRLERLLSDSINYESVIDLPAVGIAGAPNAGKSSLLNKLLGEARSIVSGQPKTTRDVLSGLLTLPHCRCVIFDCAGLIGAPGDEEQTARDELILDELARHAAMEALRNSSVVVFCVDISKADWAGDVAVRGLIEAKTLIPVATKCDLPGQNPGAPGLANRLAKLNELFGVEFLPVSVRTGAGLPPLRDTIDRRLLKLTESPRLPFSEAAAHAVGLTARHRQAVMEAIRDISEAVGELKAGNDEVTAMLLRAAYQAISGIEQQQLDEQILDTIFSRFCIGK